MKKKLKFKTLFTRLLVVVFALAVSSELIAQEKTEDLKVFKIVIEKTNDGVKMKSLKGSAWVETSFKIKNYVPQAIDEYGMTELKKVSSKKDSNLADFLFTITRTEDGIVLKGIEGTAWSDLSFSLAENGKQTIDQLGMINPN